MGRIGEELWMKNVKMQNPAFSGQKPVGCTDTG